MLELSYLFQLLSMISLKPSDCFSEDKLTELKLVHPRTNSVATFLLDSQRRKLYETQKLVRGQLSDGSFLVTDPGKLVPKTELNIISQIDPFFLILDSVMSVAPQDGPLIDYIDCMNGIIEKSPPDMQTLIQIYNTSPNFKSLFISSFCEHRNVLHRDLIRVSRDKVFEWLSSKVRLTEEHIKSSSIYLVEVAGNPDKLAKITALELIRSYLSESMYEQLTKILGYNTDSVFAQTVVETPPENQAPTNGAAKRPNPDKSTQPSAKKQKEAAVAKSCMKMTAFFKPKA